MQAKSCYIPWNNKSYKNLPIAILSFDCDDQAHVVYEKNFFLKSHKLYWNLSDIRNCHTCGNPDHVTKKCLLKRQRQPNPYSQLYDKYKPVQYKSHFPSGSRSSQSNSLPTNQGRNNTQKQPRPTSYVDSIQLKTSDPPNQSSSSSKHISASPSTNFNQQHHWL